MTKWLPRILAVIGILAIWLWIGSGPSTATPERMPVIYPKWEAEKKKAKERPLPQLQGKVVKADAPGMPSEIPGAWPCFRGPRFDGICRDETPLARKWRTDGPPVLWKLDDLADGYAGPAIWSGRVYLHDYDKEKQLEAIRCLSLDDGREIWRFVYPLAIRPNHGITRTVPAVTPDYLVAFGPKCHVTCLKPETGEYLWGMDLVAQYDAEEPAWHAAQCPLVENGRVILGTGGKALVIAVDCKTGKVLWESKNPDEWKMTHVSVLPFEVDGRRMYVYYGKGGVAGVDAENGAWLWDHRWLKIKDPVATPVDAGEGRILLSPGYQKGCQMLRIKKEGETFAVEVLWEKTKREFGSDQHTPIFHKDHFFSVIPSYEFACMDLSGKVVWRSTRAHRFAKSWEGPYIIAQDLIYVMGKKGNLHLLAARTDRYEQLDVAKVLPGHEAWAPMALVGGRLIVRDVDHMVCLDVSAKGNPNAE